MPKGVPNKRYTPEFKKLVIETMQEEKLSYSETCRRFEVNSRDRIKSWERIYLEEGPEGFADLKHFVVLYGVVVIAVLLAAVVGTNLWLTRNLFAHIREPLAALMQGIHHI